MKRLCVIILLAAWLSPGAYAQNNPKRPPAPTPEEGSYVIMDWDQFKTITQWDDAAAAAQKNHFVIPWQDVKDLLGIEIQDVNAAKLKLPWQEFKTLLEWSIKEAEQKEDGASAPVPFLITSVNYEAASVTQEGATFSATYKIDILRKKGWKSIPVLLGDVAVEKVTLPDGVFLHLEKNQYVLLTQSEGAIEAKIDFVVPVVESGGAFSLNFQKVSSGTSVIDISIPDPDVDVKISGAQVKLSREDAGKTRVVAALPAAAGINVTWERTLAEVEKVPPKLYSSNSTLVSITDGILLGRAQVSLNILHSATRQFELSVPDGVSILNVTVPGIRDWRTVENKLTVLLEREVIGTLTIDVKYEKALDEKLEKISLPVITADDVEREKGHIGVVALSNVEISSDEVNGATSFDVKDLPAEILGMTTQPILLGYRYVVPEFNVSLAINKHPDVPVLLTVVDRAYLTMMMTRDGRRITKALFNVRNNRNQFLRLQLPVGAEIWSASVAGKATQPAKDSEGRVLLPLVRSQGQGGLSAFPVEMVYVEEGEAPDAKGRGSVKVLLPVLSEPITHLMVDLYAPQDGKYREFEGTLRRVESFTPVGAHTPSINVADQVTMLQQEFVNQQAAQVRAVGASPIEVQLPLAGEVFHLEKILVIKGEQSFSFEYSGLD